MSNDPQRGITKRHSNEWRSVRWWRRRQSNRLNLINYFKWLHLALFTVIHFLIHFFDFAPALSFQSMLFYRREKRLFRVSTKDNKNAFIGLFSNWRLPEFLYGSMRALSVEIIKTCKQKGAVLPTPLCSPMPLFQPIQHFLVLPHQCIDLFNQSLHTRPVPTFVRIACRYGFTLWGFCARAVPPRLPLPDLL